MKTIVSFVGAMLLVATAFTQQLYTGLDADNYLGYASIHAQPASIAGTTAKLSFTISGALATNSNYRARNINNIIGFKENQSLKHRDHKNGGYAHDYISLDLLGIKYEINHNFSIGYGLRARFFSHLEGLPEEWTKYHVKNYIGNPSPGTPFAYEKLSAQYFNYTEHALHLGAVVAEKKENFLKAGLSLKLINGISAGYLFSESGTMTFTDPSGPNAQFVNGDMQFGYTNDGMELDQRKLGFGMSTGVVYEFRPNPGQYKYDMDGETGLVRYDIPKYKFRIGVALTDIGRVKFTKDSTSHDFSTNNTNFIADGLTGVLLNPIDYVQDNVMPAGTPLPDKRTWSMNLPASLNLQFDYKIAERLYANYSSAIPLRLPNDRNGVYQKMIHTVTPRFESQMFGASLPISIHANGQVTVGGAARFQKKGITVFVGSSNITALLGKRTVYNSGLFMGAAFNIYYKKPSDKDNDKISDGKDDCVYDPGPLFLKGCPDTDKDSIPDKADNCIYDPGTRKYRGCPDRDGDGIIDLNDQCPDQAGLAVHYGCPDKDRDGVIDVADKCPDVPGIELNNGCPFENRACCSDNDGDGISNEVDKCPETQGSVYNFGCPLDSTNIDKIPLQHIKEQLDPNHTIDKVDEITDVKRDATMITSDKEIAVPGKTAQLYSLNIYFKFDDATIPDDSQDDIDQLVSSMANANKNAEFIIIGHTDYKGSDNYNLILSRKRAEVVRRTLVNRGIPDSKIKVYYYGEWQPLKSNDNASGRQMNRRVEVRVMK